MTIPAPRDDRLAALMGRDAAAEIRRWADTTGREVHVPAAARRWQGYTEAALAQVFVTEAGFGTRMVVVKVFGPGALIEPLAHQAALRHAPRRFRRHLVERVFDPFPTRDGGALTFQALAGNSLEWHPMADLAPARIPAALARLTGALVDEWNPDFRVETVEAVNLLRREVVRVASLYPNLAGEGPAPAREPWVAFDGGPALPNPLHLLTGHSPLAGELIDVVVGHTHGDLHELNVLLRQRPDRVELESFVLVDLMSYEASAQIGRDLVRLLLSTVARLLPSLSAPQQRAFLTSVVHPDRPSDPDLPARLGDTLRAVYRTAADRLVRSSTDVWDRQFLLSLITEGLVLTTFTNLGPRRRWFFQLAALAAQRLLHELGILDRLPATPPVTPFPDPEVAGGKPGAPRPVALAASSDPGVSAMLPRKYVVCGLIGRDWVDLADLLDVPNADRARFGNGRRSFALWDWLVERDRLGELPSALRRLGLSDVANALEGRDD